MGLFSRKPERAKTALDLIEDQLKFWRSKTTDTYCRQDAIRRITEIEQHLMLLSKSLIPERIKALEDAIAEIYLMGREETNERRKD